MSEIYAIDSPVVEFNHDEHGNRLLFQNGAVNPRNELGKIGVTSHSYFSSFFYNTITISADLFEGFDDNRNPIYTKHEFYINRNSLIKYISGDANADDSDQDLIRKLQAKLWTIKSDSQKHIKQYHQMQTDAGNNLRHAGQHNKRIINHWSDPISDLFKGSFFSWLYQESIRSINLIKARFFVYGSEKDLVETSEILAKTRFTEAKERVPAYQEHIKNMNNENDLTFADIPVTSKDNYIKKNADHDEDTHFDGKLPDFGKTDTSTGTTGEPTAWVRNDEEIDTVKQSLALAGKLQMGNRLIHSINAFALGPWATGLTSYELMRQTGSVFATGADKVKIVKELQRVAGYEKRRLEKKVDELAKQDVEIFGVFKKFITDTIDKTLKSLLKDRSLQVSEALENQIASIPDDEDQNKGFSQVYIQQFINKYKSEIIAITEELNKEKKQIVIAGYPPFLKDLSNYMKDIDLNIADFSVIGVVGGQAISEAMRDILKKDGFNEIYSSYGASDLDINLGVETEYEMTVRKAIEKNPDLARELYGSSNRGLPMVFHYDPWNYHVECLDGNNNEDDEANKDKDSLVFTANRNDRSSPRIRYNLGDKGRIYAASDVQALLAKYGIFEKPRVNLPLMFVWGRDSTTTYNGANLAFTELERAITDIDPEDIILKKAFYTYHDNDGNDKLEIWLELKDNEHMPQQDEMKNFACSLISKLCSINQDFSFQVNDLDDNKILPVVRFFKRGQSPISEANGHRKQVLIFNQNNLPENYELPEDSQDCQGVQITKADIKNSTHEYINQNAISKQSI